MNGEKAVPLCLPSNHTWDSAKQCVHVNSDAPRGNLELCEDGLNVLRCIDTPVVVICIAGPVRSGKSFFISQIQNGGNFEVHHGTTSKTIGIWIASTEDSVRRNGRPARVVLLDAEGLGSVSTSDGNEDTTWERKLLALSLLLSSYFIFNSQGTPSYDDLLKLEFLSSFSKFIKKETKSADDRQTGGFSRSPPDFLWLIRDETLQPEVEGAPSTWSNYLRTKVLRGRRSHSKDPKNQIRKAVLSAFGKIDADSLPFPSVDLSALKQLDSPEGISKLNPEFVEALHTITSKILTTAKVKREVGRVIRGRDLANLLQVYVKVLNRPNGIVDVESAWECLSAEKEAHTVYYNEMKTLKMPCSEEEVHSCHTKSTQKAMLLISAKAGRSAQSDVEFFVEKFETYAVEQLRLRLVKNEEMSQSLCQRVKRQVYLNLKRIEVAEGIQFNIQHVQIAIKKALEEYNKSTHGPAKSTVLSELEELISNFETSARKLLTEKCVTKAVELYKIEMTTFQMPSSNQKLNEVHKKASLAAEKFFTKSAPSGDGQFLSGQKQKLLVAIETEKSVVIENNECYSLEHCEKLIESLGEKHLKPVEDDLGIRSNLPDLRHAFREVLEGFDSQAVGPKEAYVREKAVEDFETLVQEKQSWLIQRGLHKGEECYTLQLKNLMLPCEEWKFEEHEANCRRLAKKRFWFFLEGFPSNVSGRVLNQLEGRLNVVYKSRKEENIFISNQGHRDLIADLERRYRLRETLADPSRRSTQTIGGICGQILENFKWTAKGARCDEFYDETKEKYDETLQQCIGEDATVVATGITGAVVLGLGIYGLVKAFTGSKNDKRK